MNLSLNSLNTWIRGFGKPQQQVPELNLVPKEFLGTPFIHSNGALVLLIVVELLLAVLLIRNYGDASLTRARELLGAEETPIAVDVNQDRLERRIDQRQTTLDNLKAALSDIERQRINWPQILDLFFNRTPVGVSVTSFRPNDTEVSLSGRAQENTGIFAFQDILAQAPCVSQVELQSISAGEVGTDFIFNLGLQAGVPCE